MKLATVEAEFPEFKGGDSQRILVGRGKATEWTSAVSRAFKSIKKQIKHKRFTTINVRMTIVDTDGATIEATREIAEIVKPESFEQKLIIAANEANRELRKPDRAVEKLVALTINVCWCTHTKEVHKGGVGHCQQIDPEFKVECGCKDFRAYQPNE